MSTDTVLEKPQNGLAGLKHLRHDIVSGIVVSLVSLPLSSGIAIASGVPPIYGLISAVIAGLLFPFIGGAYLTICGPAAGLAPAIMAVMISLGGAGDAEHLGAGYHHLLVVIFLVGCVQVVLALLKLARFASIIPVTVVEGMLASIGMLIMVKQVPMIMGFTGKNHAHEFFEYVGGIPEYYHGMTPMVFAVGGTTLVLLLIMGSLKTRFFKVIPPQLIAVIIGTVMGSLLHLETLGPSFLIKLPEHPFQGVSLPDFGGLLAKPELWYAAIMAVVMLTMIDGVESLATAMAIDRIDPFHRKSDPNRVLLAMAISNIASSMVGGLTIIPGGVKSKANIASGGRTLWANFTNSICLILYLAVGASLINLIPKCVLAAVLIYTGWKMCEPAVWRHVAHIGKEQLFLFSFTILTTLLTDLLFGILAGVIANFFLNLFLCQHAITQTASELRLGRCAMNFFRNPVTKREVNEGVYHLHLDKPLVCFNAMQLSEELDDLPRDIHKVCVHLTPDVLLIDHSAMETLLHSQQELAFANIPMVLDGINDMGRCSSSRASVRIAAGAA